MNVSEYEVRKASLLSTCSNKKDEIRQLSEGPEDKYGLVKISVFLFSLTSLLPLSFFVTANDYWMYKFRDTKYPTVDPAHRTTLQAYFASSTSICKAVPTLIITIIATRYGHKIDLRKRLLWMFALMFVIFGLLTVFVNVNTDSWQLGFFVLTLILLTLVTIALIILHISMSVLLARFPPAYIKLNTYGAGSSGLFSALLQIIALTIGNDSTSAGMIYFCSGTAVILLTFIFAVFSKYLPFYTYHLGDTSKDKDRPLHTLKEFKDVAALVWPVFVIYLLFMISMGSGHPNITSLIVSEYNGNGNPWNDTYFIPVITFLLPEVVAILVRFLARPWMTRKNAKWFLVMYLIRSVVFVPAYMFCNAHKDTARHMPMLFPHDWQYITIIVVDNSITHYLVTSTFTSIPRLTEDKEKTQIAFLLLNAELGILGSILSPMSALWVKLL